MNRPVFFVAVFLGTCAGVLSYLLLEDVVRLPYWPPAVLIAGMIVGIIASGNVHAFSTWASAIGNFLFYGGIVYLANAIWHRLSSRR
jgi:uncharacterized membrane protein YkvI